ncbi:hypothetical protein [Comamonas sp.]|uniref:hypothetical protein n=1 Tax=Comamonas sp. TaxID=34028 RepID=UPI00289C3E84|nr:hypothetical protein [Comamonas sp.]
MEALLSSWQRYYSSYPRVIACRACGAHQLRRIAISARTLQRLHFNIRELHITLRGGTGEADRAAILTQVGKYGPVIKINQCGIEVFQVGAALKFGK